MIDKRIDPKKESDKSAHRVALVGNPELAIATTLAKGVVCIARDTKLHG